MADNYYGAITLYRNERDAQTDRQIEREREKDRKWKCFKLYFDSIIMSAIVIFRFDIYLIN